MKRPFAITGIVVFSCAAMLGSLLTALVPFQLETWWFWPAVRVAWQLGGGLWCGLGIAMLVDGGYFKLTAGVGALGLLLRSEEHTSELQSHATSRMPSSA